MNFTNMEAESRVDWLLKYG